jgi:DNA-binding SARP family transcriptional activator
VIELQTLGDAVIRIGKREIRPTSPAVFAALLYLGVERGRRVPRTALQELLFPETDERSGAHSLRQLLYKLRQLGASIQAEGDVVWLEAEDVSDDYSAPAHANGNGNGNGHPTGPFLSGYSPRVSDAFNEWLDTQRSTVETNRRRALIKQMLARRDAVDWLSVERIAYEILASDPFNEEATFALAESTALAGSKSEAIRILERYESETGRADLKLPAQVLRRRISERIPDRRRRALDTPFVGREQEAQVMREAIVQLRAGQGGSIVIQGEPGIGKTRLIEETTALALLEGVNVHVVRCQPHYVNRPMGVFIEWVPQLMESRGALGADPSVLEHLRLFTSHRNEHANPPTDAKDDATRSGTLFAAMRDLVDAVASEAPILLVVEDAHWADDSSIGELLTLLEQRRRSGILIALSTRTSTLDRLSVRVSAPEILRLRRLEDVPMLSLSKHLLKRSTRPDEAVAEWCASTADGNPFFLEMLCTHCENMTRPFEVPPSLRSATLRRIEHLKSDQRRVLEICAVLGRHATPRSLSSLVELDALAFLNAIQALEEGGYIRSNDGVARLSHDLLRECILDLIPPLSRQVLHRIVAAHLGERYREAATSALLWDCAEHWTASGDEGEAFESLKECARHAATIGRASQALDILKFASQFAKTPLNARTLLEDTARVAKAANNWQEVQSAGRALYELAQQGLAVLDHSDWELSLVETNWTLTLSHHSSDATAKLLRCASATDATPSHRADAAMLLLKIAFELGDLALAQHAFQSVEAVLDHRSTVATLRLVPLVYHTTFGDTVEAMNIASVLRADLSRFPIFDRLRAARNVIAAMGFLGDAKAAIELSNEYFDLAHRLDLRVWKYDLACTACFVCVDYEDFTGAKDWHDKASALRDASSNAGIDGAFLIAGAEIAIRFGNIPEAASILAKLSDASNGESIRGRALTEAYRLQLRQVDPGFTCDPVVLADLFALYRQIMHLPSAEALAVAIGVDLERREKRAELRTLVTEYANALRPGQPISSRLRAWMDQLGVDPKRQTFKRVSNAIGEPH